MLEIALGGELPARAYAPEQLAIPTLDAFAAQTKGSGHREISTTMAFVRVLTLLLRDPNIGKLIVPIIPDEARTFGMDSLFPTMKIYSPHGQKYTAVDRELMA